MRKYFNPAGRKLLVTALMLVAAISVDAITIGQLDYTLNDDDMTATVNGLGDNVEIIDNLVIPESVSYSGNTYTVVAIADQAFKGCENFSELGSLSLPSTLRHIGKEAFYGCRFRGSLTIPDGIEKIEDSTFERCVFWKGGALILPKSLKRIGTKSFSNCLFTEELVLPETLTEIGIRAFDGNSFKGHLTIPKSVTSIGECAFGYCKFTTLSILASITEIQVLTFNCCVELTDVTFSTNTITEIQEEAFFGCYNLRGTLRLPDSVKSIGQCAFNSTRFSEIYLGSRLESIGYLAFYGDTTPNYIECATVQPPVIVGDADFLNYYCPLNHRGSSPTS